MGLRNSLRNLITGLLIERPAQKRTLADMAAQLEAAGQELARRFAAAGGTPAHRGRLRHIIGIERWGQRRLQVALGQPLVMDEYDGYRPAADLDWVAIQEAFRTTRAETVALARELAAANASQARIPHNQFGKLSVGGWLQYLNFHANQEARRIR